MQNGAGVENIPIVDKVVDRIESQYTSHRSHDISNKVSGKIISFLQLPVT